MEVISEEASVAKKSTSLPLSLAIEVGLLIYIYLTDESNDFLEEDLYDF